MAIVEVKCPHCGSPCTEGDRKTNEYICSYCGTIFRLLDTTKREVIRDTRAHYCSICGRSTVVGKMYTCMECGKEYLCPDCVQHIGGIFICIQCLKNKWFITEPLQVCPKCAAPLIYKQEYNRWYCNSCQVYVTHICWRCGKPTDYVQSYGKWYCHNCKLYLEKYAPSYLTTTQPHYACSACGKLKAATQMAERCNKCGTLLCQQCVVYKDGKAYCYYHQPTCFIATAAFGTSMSAEIQVLRDFRDAKLNPNSLGKQLVRLYYSASPMFANIIVRSENMRALTRTALRPVVLATSSRTKTS
jgi:hypothetical protein